MNWQINNQLRPSQRSTSGSRVIVALFGLLFLAFGCGFLYLILLRPLGQIIAARQWVATPSQVVSSAVQSGTDSTHGSTYSVAIRYTYTVNNKRYESSRYDLVGGASSGRAGKEAIVRQHPPGSELTCFVNPRDPSIAVIDRGLRPIMWFALLPCLFVAIGIFCLVAAFRKTTAVAPETASVPWQSRKDWADGRIKSADRQSFVVISLFAVFCNAISWAVLIVNWSEVMRAKGPGKWIEFLFPAVGVGLLSAAVYCLLKWLKFGRAVFEMASVPGAVGGALEGTIKLGRFLRFPEGVTVRLRCVRQVTTGSGDSRHTQETILWESERHVPDAGGADSIPVLFAIPADAEETDGTNPSDEVLWRLSAKAKLPGIDLSETFAVPVYKVAQAPAQIAAAQRARAVETTELAHYERPATSRIRIRTVADGTEFYFPAARNPGAATGLTVFTLIWLGAIFCMVHFKAPVLFAMVFGLFGVILLVIVASLWLGTTRIVAAKTGITVAKRLAGIPRYRAIAIGEIAAITLKQGMTAGTTVYHDIKICLNSKEEITAGSSIHDYEEARWLASEMARCAAVTYRS